MFQSIDCIGILKPVKSQDGFSRRSITAGVMVIQMQDVLHLRRQYTFKIINKYKIIDYDHDFSKKYLDKT